MNLVIKEVNEELLELATKLQAEIFPNEKSPKQIVTGIKTGNPKNFIAYSNGEPVGIVGYYFSKECPDHVLINWYGVLKQFRRKGYGVKIINWLIKTCKKLNYKYLTTYTDLKENKAAILLYKKMGFEVVNYCNAKDLQRIKDLGIKHKYVLVTKKLKRSKDIDYKMVNLNIAENYLIYTKNSID